MNKIITSALIFGSILFFGSCSKPKNDPTVGNSTSHPNVTIDNIINTWVDDDEGNPGNWVTPVHFYAGKTNVSIEMHNDHSYIFKYTSISSGSVITENGIWAYDANTYTLTMSPPASAPYTYRVALLSEEQFQFYFKYPTYDNEGVQNGTAEEIVHLEDND